MLTGEPMARPADADDVGILLSCRQTGGLGPRPGDEVLTSTSNALVDAGEDHLTMDARCW